jgi:hypothetical protein
MRKNAIKVMMGFFAVMVFGMTGCGSESTAPSTNNSTNNSSNVFTWTENGSATVQTATTANFSTQFKTLKAYNGATLLFEINLNGTTPATYALDGINNVITYTNVTPWFVPTTGNVIITANANAEISGTFQGTGPLTSGITSVAGTFTKITVVP